MFATGGTAIKFSAFDGPALAGLRSLVAAFVFFVVVVSRRSGDAGAFARVGTSGFVTAACYAATMAMFVVANKLTTAANTIFLQSTAPIYVLFASSFLLGERAGRRDLAYAGVMAAGMVAFFVGSDPSSATAVDPDAGNRIAAASGLTWAGTILGLRRLRIENRPVMPILFLGNALAFAACLPWILRVPAPAPADAVIVVYLGAFQVALAYVALSTGVRTVAALEVSLLLLLEPVVSSILAAAVHREIPGFWSAVGCVVILGATVVRAFATPKPGR